MLQGREIMLPHDNNVLACHDKTLLTWDSLILTGDNVYVLRGIE